MLQSRIIQEVEPIYSGAQAIIYKGEIEGIGECALKVARDTVRDANILLQEEFELSTKLSMLLPNVARYHSMVQVEGYDSLWDFERMARPTFAMDWIEGYKLSTVEALTKSRQGRFVHQKAADQLRENLQIAYDNHFRPVDLQYFILSCDQVLNGKEYSSGDIILFDFAEWVKEDSHVDIGYHVRELERLVQR